MTEENKDVIKLNQKMHSDIEELAKSTGKDLKIMSEETQKKIATQITEFFIKNYSIITMIDNQEMYIYCEGIYLPKAECYIKRLISIVFNCTESNHIVKEILGKIERATYKTRQVFDQQDKLEICCQNGVLNLKTRELRQHNSKDFFLAKLPVEYNPDSTCPIIEKFIQEVCYSPFEMQEKIDQLYEIIGWCLMPQYFPQKAVLLHGSGSNGKSTYIELVKNFLGKDNVTSIALHDFEENQFATSELYGKLANLYADLDKRTLRYTAKLKILTGNDNITSWVKFKDGKSFTNRAKMIFSCNVIPKTYDDTLAFWRRMLIIDFTNIFSEGDQSKTDPHIINKLIIPQELSGLFNKALDGIDRIIQNMSFTNIMNIEETRKKYLSRSNPIQDFAETCLERGTIEDTLTRDELYNAFIIYMSRNKLLQHVSDITQTKFTRDFKKVKLDWITTGFTQRDGNSIPVYRCVKLVNQPQQPELEQYLEQEETEKEDKTQTDTNDLF